MDYCSYCSSLILFGGVRNGHLRFCNAKCHQKGAVLVLAQTVPEEIVEKAATEIHEGECPKCRGRGPVDVHTSHSVWSALLLTSWSSKPTVCCRACGVRNQLTGMVKSLFLGWWGFPWGLVMTPVQIVRNVIGICSPPPSMAPSRLLHKHVSMGIAHHAMSQPPPPLP